MRTFARTDSIGGEERESASNDPALDGDVNRLLGLFLSMGRRRSIRDPIATICEDLGFSPAQLHCLLWLGYDVALTMGELARRVGITEKTVTGIVDRLEEARHVHRERDTADRRVIRVLLTDAGAEVFRRIDSNVSRHLGHALSCLDRADRDTLFNLFEKLHDRLEAHASGEETK